MGERALVTGVAGFLGEAVERRVLAGGAQCLGLGRARRARPGYRALDLASEPAALGSLMAEWRPDVIYHLAGGAAAGDPFVANVATTRVLLEAVRAQAALRPRVVVVGSAAEYGDLGPEPVGEEARERPVTEYGVAKLAQTRLALVFRRAGMRVTVARPFNVMGPGMSASLAPARFAREALSAVSEGRDSITVGDLSTIRDYLDVEDVARAIWKLGQLDPLDEIVNVCSGRGITTGDVLEEVVRQVGVSLATRADPRLVRGPHDVPVCVGNPGRLGALMGEALEFSLHRSVARLLLPLRTQQVGRQSK